MCDFILGRSEIINDLLWGYHLAANVDSIVTES